MCNWTINRAMFAGLFALMYLMAGAAGTAGAQDIGQPASDADLAWLDIDVAIDGAGLPEGSGTAEDGEWLYDERCASCHGTFGEGEGRFPALAGGMGTLMQGRPIKTVGSFWPYTTTLFDYVYRTMPFGDAQSLTADETYAIVAYTLYLNDLIEADLVLDQDNLAEIELPNRNGFVMAPNAPDTPQDRCMSDCRESVTVHSRASALQSTPEDGGQENGGH